MEIERQGRVDRRLDEYEFGSTLLFDAFSGYSMALVVR